MPRIIAVDPTTHFFHVHHDLTVSTVAHRPGPPERVDGMAVGIVTMEQSAPHGGEVHPDGDEILYVVSGRIRVHGDCAPDAALTLGPGGACIVPRGEWHTVDVLETTTLLHLTPGPGGDHRPLET